MARNRRSTSAAARFGPALRALLLCLVLGSAGVGYVWQKNEIYALAHQKKLKENALDKLRRENKQNHDRLEFLRLPWVIEAKLKELKLGLGPAQPEQIVRLTEPTVGVSSASAMRQYADQGLRREVVR